jgi:hypothetical protein
VQERQDQSLWKITLSLPDECISELEKVKNRSNLKLKNTKDELVATGNSVDPKLSHLRWQLEERVKKCCLWINISVYYNF